MEAEGNPRDFREDTHESGGEHDRNFDLEVCSEQKVDHHLHNVLILSMHVWVWVLPTSWTYTDQVSVIATFFTQIAKALVLVMCTPSVSHFYKFLLPPGLESKPSGRLICPGTD